MYPAPARVEEGSGYYWPHLRNVVGAATHTRANSVEDKADVAEWPRKKQGSTIVGGSRNDIPSQ